MAENKRLAALRSKFNSTANYVPTPENQFGRMKKSKEQNVRAVRVAKARAARYNMTIRALAIKTTVDVSKMQRKELVGKKDLQKEHANYKATSRGLNVNRGVTAKDRSNIAKALNESVSPAVAKDVIKAVARKTVNDHASNANEEEEDVKTDDGEDEVAKKEEKAKKVEMSGVKEALTSDDPNALNRAILSNFLEGHAPHLLDQTDVLLNQFSEKLDVLFSGLLNKFPNGEDSAVSGQQKADKEIADAIDSGDKKLPSKEELEKEALALAAGAEDGGDEEDSLVETGSKKEDLPVPRKEIKVEDFTLGLGDNENDEEDSIVAVDEQAETFKRAYNKTLKKGERSNIHALKSLARRRTTVKMNSDLTEQVKEYEKKERQSFKTIKEDDDEEDSLVETSPNEQQYITNIEEVKPETTEAPVRWAVNFENKNAALKKKLMKQGLNEEQVADLVDNLDTNTSEML